MNPTWLFVGAVYALAVWLARRAGVDLRPRIAAFFYALVLLFLFRPMTQDYVNLPIDIVDTLPPWSHQAVRPRMANPEMSDITLQIVPWAHQVREQWKSLRVPLWNELEGSGYPLLANGQSAPFSFLRLATLPLSLGNAFTAEAALKLLIALTFTYLFCRRRGWGELPSSIGAVSFAFCTFLHVWLHFPLVTVASMLPAAFYVVDLLLERPTYGRFLFAVLVWVGMLFGGHPETVSHTTFLCGLYLVWVVLVEKHEQRLTWPFVRDRFAAVIGAVIVAALVAMPAIAPLVEALPRSKRFQELKVQPNEIGYYSDLPSQIVLFQPNWFGHPPQERVRGTATAPESTTGFAGALAIAAFVTLLLRGIFQRRWREREFFFVLASFLVLGVILAWPGISTGFHALFKLAANARLRLFLCWLLSIQLAAVLDLIRRERAWHFLAGILVTSAVMLWLMQKWWFPEAMDKDTAMISIIPSMAVLGLAALIPLLGEWKQGRVKDFALMLAAVAIVAELWTAIAGWNPTFPAKRMFHSSPMLDKLARLRDGHASNEPFRIVGLGPVFFPNLSGVYGYEDIRAHDPMANGRYLGILRARDNYDTSRYFAKFNEMSSRTLDFLNVQYVLGDVYNKIEDAERYQLVYSGKDGRIFQNHDVLPRFYSVRNVDLEFRREVFVKKLLELGDFRFTVLCSKLKVDSDRERSDLLAPRPAGAPEATMRIDQAAPTEFRLHVSAPRYTMIASSTPFWPGWRVVANGKTLRNVEINGAFLGFVVPPGESDVRVDYSPRSFKAGVAVSLATLLVLGAFGAGWRPRRRRAAAAAG
jgi:hypothetical protein